MINSSKYVDITSSIFGVKSSVSSGGVSPEPPIPPDPVGPFYALKDSSYNYAQLDSPVTLPDDGMLSFYMIPNDTAVSEYAIRSSSGDACVNYRHSDGRFRVCTDDGRLFTFTLTSLIVGEQAYLVVRLIDNGCQLYVNGILHEELTGVHTTMTIDQIGEGVNTYGVTIGNLVSYPMVVDVVGEVNAIDTIGSNNITYIDLTSPLTISEYNEVTLDY